MKTLICACCLLMLVSSAFADTATIDVYAGPNLIALPRVPLTTDASAPTVLGIDGSSLDSVLSRYEAAGNADVTFSQWAPEEFGGMLLGEGYWLTVPDTMTISYTAAANGVPSAGVKTDMWISLPGNQFDSYTDMPNGGGWHLIGNPYDEPVNKSKIYITDGKDLLSWEDAYNAGWVAEELQGYLGQYQASYTVSIFWGDGDDLLPGRGYWFYTYKDNLAMIIMAP